MRNTNWYKKDIEETLDYYYKDLNNEECLEHLMFWLENYPKLDFEWVDMILDLGNFEQIPIETVLIFADRVYEINPDYYILRYEFIEGRILDHAFMVNNLELIKKRLEILQRNPVNGIDTVVTDTLFRLIFYGYYGLAMKFSEAVWKPLLNSEELYGYPEFPFAYTVYLYKLEKQSLLDKKDKRSWNSFVNEIESYGFEKDKERLDVVYQSLFSEPNPEAINQLADKQDFKLVSLNIHFMKYMKEKYNFPFMLSGLWYNIINTQKLLGKKMDFFVPFTKLDKHIIERYDNFLGSNQIELFGKMWGLHYVYEFLNNYDFIANDEYEVMKENNAFLKFEFMKAFSSDLWKFTFIHKWPETGNVYISLPEKEYFEKTYTMNYDMAQEHFHAYKIDIQGSDRIEAEIIADCKMRDDYIETPFYSGDQPFVKEEPDVGRNDPCPCRSGKKYKKCCMNKT